MITIDEALHKIHAENILDVATGRGDFILSLREALGSFGFAIGIDVKSGPAWEGKDFDPQWVSFQEMDAANLTFADHSFDLVSISNSLHHMPNPEKTLSEMVRVLKPGGFFIFREMFTDGQTESQQTHSLLHQWWAKIDTEAGISHHSPMLRSELIKFLEKTSITDWQYYEEMDLSSDPFDQETLVELDKIIDTYQAKTNNQALVNKGEELRLRVKNVGFHSATEFYAIGKKI